MAPSWLNVMFVQSQVQWQSEHSPAQWFTGDVWQVVQLSSPAWLKLISAQLATVWQFEHCPA